MLRELVVAIGLLALVFFSACAEDETFLEEYKQACLSLTVYSPGYIPKCSSPENCFELVENNLFNFPQDSLSLQSRQFIYHYKVHLAKSWFHHNEAIKSLEEVREYCRVKNFDSAILKSNDFRFDIERSFYETERALDSSFALILSKKAWLESEDINLIKEEPLYSTYIKLSDNSRQLFSDKFLGLDNYTSNYWRIAMNVRFFRDLHDSGPKILRQRTVFSLLLSFVPTAIEQQISDQTIYTIPLAETAQTYLSKALQVYDAARFVEFLREERPDEFLGMLSDYTGQRASLATEFALLSKELSLNHAFIEREIDAITNLTDKRLRECRETASFFSSPSLAFVDSEFTQNLHSLLDEQLSVSKEPVLFDSVADAHFRALPEIAALEKDCAVFQRDLRAERVSLGNKASKSKELLSKAEGILHSLNSLKESFYFLSDRCNSKVKRIESKHPGILLLVEKYNSAKPEQKLEYCTKIISQIQLIEKKAFSDDVAIKESICYKKLSVLLDFVSDQRIRHSYNSLADSNFALHECENLIRLAETDIRKNHPIAELEGLFEEIRQLRAFLDRFERGSDKEFVELSSFFEGQEMILEKSLPEINALEWRLRDMHSDSLKESGSFLMDFLEKNHIVKAFPLGAVELSDSFQNIELLARHLVYFENPFFYFDNPLAVELPFDAIDCTTLTHTPNISGVFKEGGILRIEMDFLAKERTFVELQCVASASLQHTGTEASLSSEFGTVLEKYLIETKSQLSRIKIILSAPENYSYARIVRGNRQIPVIKKNSFISAELTDVFSGEEFIARYSLINPINSELSLVSTHSLPDNLLAMDFICIIENKTRFESENSSVLIPIAFPATKIQITDAQGKNVSFSKEAKGARIIIPMLPYARKTLRLSVITADLNNLSSEVYDKIKLLIDDLNNPDLRKRAEDILTEVDSHTSPEKLQLLYEEAVELTSRDSEKKIVSDQYFFLRNSLKKSLNDLNYELLKAKELGFFELAESISEKIVFLEKSLSFSAIIFSSEPDKAIKILEEGLIEINKDLVLPEKKLIKKAKLLLEDVDSISMKIRSINLNDEKSAEIVTASKKHYEQFLDSVSKQSIGNASDALKEIEKSLFDLNEYFESVLYAEAVKLRENIAFINLVSYSFRDKISFLEDQLESVSTQLLVEARYQPAFGKSLLNRISNCLLQSEEAVWGELETLLINGDTFSALLLAKEQKLSDDLLDISTCFAELQAIEKNLAREAEYYVVLAEENNIETAETARKLFLNKKYLSAVALVKSSLSNEEPPWHFFIFAVLTLVVLSAFILIKKRSKKDKKPPMRVLKNFSSLNSFYSGREFK